MYATQRRSSVLLGAAIVIAVFALLLLRPVPGLADRSDQGLQQIPGMILPQAASPPAPSIDTTLFSLVETDVPDLLLNWEGWSRNVVRDSKGGVHVTWKDRSGTPDYAFYSSSRDQGVMWAAPTVLGSSTREVYACYLTIGHDDAVHAFYGLFGNDLSNLVYQSRIGTTGDWGGPQTIGAYNDEVAQCPVPALDDAGDLHLVYDESHYRGLGYRLWDGSWSAKQDVLSASYDFQFQNTIEIDGDLFVFTRRWPEFTLRLFSRQGGTWGLASTDTTFAIQRGHSEVVDGDGIIWSFVREAASPFRIRSRAFDPDSGWVSGWDVLETGPGLDWSDPSATVDHEGNVWVFYTIDEEIVYRVLSSSTGVWSATTRLTDAATDGLAIRPRVRYQSAGHAAPGIIELTWASHESTPTSRDLWYGRIVLPGSATTPTAVPDSYRALPSGSLIATPGIGVLHNDRDPDGDSLTAHLANGASVGTVTLSPDGSFTYSTPTTPSVTSDTFSYRAFDGSVYSEPASVTVRFNDPPVVADDTYSMNRYETLVQPAPGVLDNDSDDQGDDLSCVLAGPASEGTVTLNPDGSFEYTPSGDYAGSDTFTYRAFDGKEWSAEAEVKIDISATHAAHGEVLDWETGGPLSGIVVRMVRRTDSDPEGTSQVWTTVTGGDGTWRITGLPDAGYYYITLLDRADVYRDAHWWAQGVPIDFSASFRVDGLTDMGWTALMKQTYCTSHRVGRLSGDDRYRTGMAMAESFGSADTVVLASGLGFPDALAAAPLAGAHSAPILLTPPDRLPSGFRGVMDELGATGVIIVGGESAVSRDVRDELIRMGYSVQRFSGPNRYATAEAICREVARLMGGSLPVEPIIVRGDDFADALAIAPFAWIEARPILLVEPDKAPPDTIDAFRFLRNRYGTDTVVVIGGESAVSYDALFDLWANVLYPADLYEFRVKGANRYDTAARCTSEYWGIPVDVYGLASGTSFPDALSAGPLLGSSWGALLLTPQDSLAPEARSQMRSHRTYLWQIVVAGGDSAVSGGVASAAGSAIGTSYYDMDFLSGVASAMREQGTVPHATDGTLGVERLSAVTGIPAARSDVFARTGEVFPQAAAVHDRREIVGFEE